MEKFILNITASSGEFYQGYCESLTLPTGDGVYGVQAGHNPVLVALHMGIAKFTVDGETREVLVGDGIAEVTPTFVLLLVAYGPKTGLAPLHTWKPDAYGEAPGVVGAILAGGVTSCAFLALLRVYRV